MIEKKPSSLLTLRECQNETILILESLCKNAVSKARTPYDPWHILHIEASNIRFILTEQEPPPPLIMTSIAKLIDYMDAIVQSTASDALCQDFYKHALELSKAFSPIAQRLMKIYENSD